MKLAIASDIHGSALWCERFLAQVDEERADAIVLLGDLLYHGPRNELPEGYDPKRVASLLNEQRRPIIAVRGNCDSEVDQMMLEFPCLADYAAVFFETYLFCTHGHVFGSGRHNSVDNMPKLPQNSALVFGHTHIKVNERDGRNPGVWLFNPGSVSLPKDGSHSFGVFENGSFSHRILH